MTTVREWLDIYSDLDAYIAKGGQLLDLRIGQMDDAPEALQLFVAEQLGVERMERLDRYNMCIVDAMKRHGDDARVGDILTEDDLRAIWRETANANPVAKRATRH